MPENKVASTKKSDDPSSLNRNQLIFYQIPLIREFPARTEGRPSVSSQTLLSPRKAHEAGSILIIYGDFMKIVQSISERVFPWKKDQDETEERKLIVRLDRDSQERFKRLKSKISGLNNDQIIASALKCLDQKTDRIIKRQIRKRQGGAQ